MKALVYHGPGKISLEEKPKPVLCDATDAIVRVTKTTICGTDLHIIIGWVAMWHPIEALLYDWWPIREQRQYFDKIALMDVEVKGISIQ